MEIVQMTVLIIALSCVLRLSSKPLPSRNPRIAGGSESLEGSYPFVVSLQDLTGHFCAGTIVSKYLLLTAAHCTFRENFFVRAGSIKAHSGGSEHRVVDVIRHDNYTKLVFGNYISVKNDVALVIVEPPIDLSKYAGIVQFAGRNETGIEGKEVTLVGWGATRMAKEGDFEFGHQKYEIKHIFTSYNLNHYFSEVLKSANATIVSRTECARHYRLTENQICTKSSNATGCAGDSGGPLLLEGRQVAIKYGGAEFCSAQNSFDVYVEVAPYRDWIDAKVRLRELIQNEEPSSFWESFFSFLPPRSWIEPSSSGYSN